MFEKCHLRAHPFSQWPPTLITAESSPPTTHKNLPMPGRLFPDEGRTKGLTKTPSRSLWRPAHLLKDHDAVTLPDLTCAGPGLLNCNSPGPGLLTRNRHTLYLLSFLPVFSEHNI